MSTLEQAIRLALDAHAGQFDKAGAPYILHPLRMMTRLAVREEQIAAVLHDVVEDSDVTLDDLRAMGFDDGVVSAVDGLTRRSDETYEAFILRARDHPVARAVKLADLEDNMDVRRLGDLTDKDLQRLRRYRAAWRVLMDGR